MNNQTLAIAISTFLIGGIGGYLLSTSTGNGCCHGMMFQDHDQTPMGKHRMSDGSMMNTSEKMNTGDMNGMGHMMHMMVSSEREFIEGMIPHHQEAIDTAKEVVTRGGTTPEIKQLVENIIMAQEAEIAQMKEWYKDWYSEEYTDSGKYVPMMRDLSQLSGTSLDRAFLEDMIMHHRGAIMMAQSIQPYITHPEIDALTEAINKTQSNEIDLMRQLLSGV